MSSTTRASIVLLVAAAGSSAVRSEPAIDLDAADDVTPAGCASTRGTAALLALLGLLLVRRHRGAA